MAFVEHFWCIDLGWGLTFFPPLFPASASAARYFSEYFHLGRLIRRLICIIRSVIAQSSATCQLAMALMCK